MIWEYEMSGEDKRLIEEDSKSFVIHLNENRPYFTDDDIRQLEGKDHHFSNLDDKRCGVAFACISNNTLSSSRDRSNEIYKRPKIQSKPSGFPESVEENTVNGRFVFQRCHLIGYQLYAKRVEEDGKEDVNLKRIFTGTRFMNNIMLYYENQVKNYVKNSNNHVLYRVTPYFKDHNKLACGIQIEAKFRDEEDKEDKERSFNVFIYNRQPDISLNYGTGVICKKKSNNLIEKISDSKRLYVLNKKKKKFHIKGCASVDNAPNANELHESCEFSEKRNALIEKEYRPCTIECMKVFL